MAKGRKKRKRSNQTGSRRGKGFERKVCPQLSMLVSRGTREDLFWRASMSGGRSTVRNRGEGPKHKTIGDIVAIDPLGNQLTDHFALECKSYGQIGFEALIFGASGNAKHSLRGWWMEIKRKLYQAESQHLPLLLVKKVGFDTLCFTDLAGVTKLRMRSKVICIFSIRKDVVYAFRFRDWLNLKWEKLK